MKLCGAGLHDLDDPAVAYVKPGDGRRRCRPCRKSYSSMWLVDHAEQFRATRDAWKVANPERVRIASAAYYRIYHARHPEYYSAKARAWLAANPERAAVNLRTGHARRRALLARVLATLTTQEWEAILDAAGHACIYCGSRKQITQDHLIPLSRGGNHTAENVAPACRTCNCSKQNKTPEEFLAEAV